MSDYEDKIKAYLDKRAAEDELFAKSYAKENKSLEECCLYILGEAMKKAVEFERGKAAVMDDDAVYGLAVHYYDEDDIKLEPLNSVRAEVTTSQSAAAYKPSKKDRENAKKAALERLIEEERNKLVAPRKKKQHDEPIQSNQMSLFA
ncbi:MAG: PcfK-like family protein [Bacteroidales bacterium]|nr:PcfK-like family protein [Bacteroidales bacterium]